MAQYLTVNNSSTTNGVGFNCDRLISQINPSGTIIIYDNNGNQLKIIYGSDPEISVKEG
jgi:hypothetical protein